MALFLTGAVLQLEAFKQETRKTVNAAISVGLKSSLDWNGRRTRKSHEPRAVVPSTSATALQELGTHQSSENSGGIISQSISVLLGSSLQQV